MLYILYQKLRSNNKLKLLFMNIINLFIKFTDIVPKLIYPLPQQITNLLLETNKVLLNCSPLNSESLENYLNSMQKKINRISDLETGNKLRHYDSCNFNMLNKQNFNHFNLKIKNIDKINIDRTQSQEFQHSIKSERSIKPKIIKNRYNKDQVIKLSEKPFQMDFKSTKQIKKIESICHKKRQGSYQTPLIINRRTSSQAALKIVESEKNQFKNMTTDSLKIKLKPKISNNYYEELKNGISELDDFLESNNSQLQFLEREIEIKNILNLQLTG